MVPAVDGMDFLISDKGHPTRIIVRLGDAVVSIFRRVMIFRNKLTHSAAPGDRAAKILKASHTWLFSKIAQN